jgi:hypothetical protein
MEYWVNKPPNTPLLRHSNPRGPHATLTQSLIRLADPEIL